MARATACDLLRALGGGLRCGDGSVVGSRKGELDIL
jgi:hypothetical protein